MRMNPTDSIKLLTKVRELLSDPARWTQGTAARNVEGRHVTSTDPNATCWCLMGAVWKHAPFIGFDAMNSLLSNGGNATFNDARTTTHSDILSYLDSRITHFKALEQGK